VIMGLMRCPDCSEQISTNARTCPNCGNDNFTVNTGVVKSGRCPWCKGYGGERHRDGSFSTCSACEGRKSVECKEQLYLPTNETQWVTKTKDNTHYFSGKWNG
jgi:hypothetical protein